jgi:hypothetical protein
VSEITRCTTVVSIDLKSIVFYEKQQREEAFQKLSLAIMDTTGRPKLRVMSIIVGGLGLAIIYSAFLIAFEQTR